MRMIITRYNDEEECGNQSRPRLHAGFASKLQRARVLNYMLDSPRHSVCARAQRPADGDYRAGVQG
eukprot:9488439-Pyramimonas_sp.AAC.1